MGLIVVPVAIIAIITWLDRDSPTNWLLLILSVALAIHLLIAQPEDASKLDIKQSTTDRIQQLKAEVLDIAARIEEPGP